MFESLRCTAAAKPTDIELTEEEYQLLVDYADQHEISPEQAANRLFSNSLAQRIGAATGQRPSATVLRLQRRLAGDE